LELEVNDEVNITGDMFTLSDVIIDTPEYDHRTGEGYTGYIYKICIHQYIPDDYDVVFPPVFECEINEVLNEETGLCEDCLEDCVTCVRTTDCRACDADTLCEQCETYDAECEPDGCMENTELIDGVCVCPSPKMYQIDVDQCIECIMDNCLVCDKSTECITCHDGYYLTDELTCSLCTIECATCADETNTSCPECSADHYHIPGTLQCESSCPTGLLPEEDECILPTDLSDVEYCFTFDDKPIPAPYSEPTLIADIDSEPLPATSRGMYFDGNRGFTIQGIALSTTFTIEFWVRPLTAGSLLRLGDTYLDLMVDQFAQVSFDETSYSATTALVPEWTKLIYTIALQDLTI